MIILNQCSEKPGDYGYGGSGNIRRGLSGTGKDYSGENAGELADVRVEKSILTLMEVCYV